MKKNCYNRKLIKIKISTNIFMLGLYKKKNMVLMLQELLIFLFVRTIFKSIFQSGFGRLF